MSEAGLAHDLTAFAEQRVAGTHTVDPWGFDADVYDLAARAGRLRWAVHVDGAAHVPTTGPALLVVNRRLGLSEPAVVAMGVHEATGRRVRPVGIPDLPVLGEVLRRLGGVLDAPAEIRGLLRAGEVVAVPCSRQPFHARTPGVLRAAAVRAALDAGAPVLPVAVLGHELGLAWHVRVGAPVPIPSGVDRTALDRTALDRTGVDRPAAAAAPAGVVDDRAATLADAARDALAALLAAPVSTPRAG